MAHAEAASGCSAAQCADMADDLSEAVSLLHMWGSGSAAGVLQRALDLCCLLPSGISVGGGACCRWWRLCRRTWQTRWMPGSCAACWRARQASRTSTLLYLRSATCPVRAGAPLLPPLLVFFEGLGNPPAASLVFSAGLELLGANGP